jgi:phage-related protein
MSQAKLRNVVLFKTYFSDFYRKQRKDVQKKILWTLKLIEIVREIPVDYFKHLTGTNGLFEIRVQHGTDKFRIFCFFDQGRLLILGNGFHKKTQKTPLSEIDKALKIKSEYENKK